VSESVLYMSMSPDGYIAGSNDEPGNPGGDGFMRLHDQLSTHSIAAATPSNGSPYPSARRLPPG